jgi:hypothetical protein
LARRILAGEVAEGERVHVDYVDGEYTFSKAQEAAPAKSA